MLKRRQFLLGIGSGALAIGASPLLRRVKAAAPAPVVLAREESWARSICQLCGSGCGLSVRLINGKPVTVTGNPLHPVNRGGLCARGAAGLQLYYDPDRLAGPMVRDRSVLGGWAPIAWDEALGRVGQKLAAAIEQGSGRIAVIRGDGATLTAQLLGRLARAARSRWVVDMKPAGQRAASEVLRRMHGRDGQLVYDLANATTLLSLDSALLESPANSMVLHRGFAEMRSRGGTFIHAGPRLGVTGAKADTWLPVRPSTAGILALGIAHMMIKEGYERTDFLRHHVDGYFDGEDAGGMRGGIRSWILREFSPERVSELTGVRWDQLIRTARTFGRAERPLAVGPLDGESRFSVFDAAAAHVLNAIAGSIDTPGGVLLARESPFAPLERLGGEEGALGEPSPTVEELADWVLADKKPQIDVCLVHEADPVFTSVAGGKVREALRKIPLVVSTSPVMTDTVDAADVVLPDRLWIERRSDATVVDGSAHPVVSLSPAAAPARADARHTAEVVLALAKRSGEAVARHFPWANYDAVVREMVRALAESQTGDTFSDEDRSVWVQLMERSGWRSPSYRSASQLEKQMEELGGWWDPAYYHGEWARVVAREERRINVAPLRSVATAEILSRPEEPAENELLLYIHSEPTLAARAAGSLPYLQDLSSPFAQRGWVTTAELNPETAERLGVAHGDAATIENDYGSVSVRVIVSPG
ncbi:MAG: hypothetical protein D6760_05865, partial [Deltaproteobacteria bacterium]